MLQNTKFLILYFSFHFICFTSEQSKINNLYYNSKDIELIKKKLAKKLYKFDSFKITRIKMGQTNRVYKIENIHYDKIHILIIPQKNLGNKLGLKYDSIFKNTQIAGKLGISPEVVYYDRELLIENFIEGSVLYPNHNISSKILIKEVINLFFQLHESSKNEFKRNKVPFEDLILFYSKLEKPSKLIKKMNIKMNDILNLASQTKRKINYRVKLKFCTPCHNDIQGFNVIYFYINNKLNIKFIDWDYSGISDRFYDLVSGLNRLYFNDKEIETAVARYIFKIGKKYSINDDIFPYLQLYSMLMLSLANYWCALFHSIKLEENKYEDKIYRLKKINYYYNRFEKYYCKIFDKIPVI